MAAYLIVDIKQIRDEKAYAQYRESVPASLAAGGGEYLARGGAVQVLEGDWTPGRLVVVRFETSRAARDWWASEQYAALRSLRWACSSANMVLVEGVSTPTGS
jgi:uncharacterized protein (DUF1330 family)